jgi:hypothetical protein
MDMAANRASDVNGFRGLVPFDRKNWLGVRRLAKIPRLEGLSLPSLRVIESTTTEEFPSNRLDSVPTFEKQWLANEEMDGVSYPHDDPSDLFRLQRRSRNNRHDP